MRYFRDKLAMRMQALEHGIRVPDFIPVLNHDDIRYYLSQVSGPWVLKPRSEASAIGIKLNRPIVSHGFALNLTTDLGYFDGIVPCGHVDKRPTSVEAITGHKVETEVAARAYAEHFARVFDTALVWASPQKVLPAPAR